MSEPAPSAELGVQATPLHELERLLASRPQPSTSRSAVSAATPRVDLLLRPAPAPTAVSGVVLPSSKDSASVAPVLPSSSTAAATATGASDVSSQSRVCAACQRQYAKYVCPKCNLNTCSLPCYKSHNEQCTHGFAASALAEERVIDTALRQGLGRTRAVLGDEYKAAQEARKTTSEIMQRVADFNQNDAARMESIMSTSAAAANQEADDDDAKEGDEEQQNEERLMAALMLIERMDSKSAASKSSAAISNAELLELQSLLPPAMLKDFQRSIVDGRMSAWLARWKPWWRNELQLLTEDDSDSTTSRAPSKEQDLTPQVWSIPSVQISVVSADESDDAPANAPPMPEAVPAFSSLFPGSPSPLLPVHLIELLYAYAYALMLYNGDPDAEVEGIVGVMALLSPVLTGTATPAQAAGAAAASASITAASSAAAVAHPSPPSFVPTPSLLTSLDASVTALLSTASSSPSLSSSCCWAVARLGDVCQLQCSKTNVIRALAHMQAIVERAKASSKKTKSKEKSTAAKSAAGAPSAAGAASSSPSASLSYSSMSRKLVFFQSFVSGVLSDTQLREWNRALYGVWQQRWQMHTEMHANKSAAPGQQTTPAASKQKATIQIVE